MALLGTIAAVLSGTVSSVLTKYVAALVIIFVGFVVARLLGLFIKMAMKEAKVNVRLSNLTGVQVSIEEIVSTVLVYVVYFLTIVMALNQIGLTSRVFDIVAISVIVIMLVSIAIALKDFFPNVVAGIYLLHWGFVKKGQKVKVDTTEGIVKEINLLETKIETKDKDILLVPNAQMVKKVISILK